MTTRVDIGIVTAVQIEFDAVVKGFQFSDFPLIPDGPTYAKGHWANYSIVVTRASDKGNVYSSIATLDIVRDYNPNIIVLIGMAGAHGSEVQVGSIVFGTIVLGYEYSKILDSSIRKAPRQYRIPDEDKQIAAELDVQFRPHLGVIASGSKVIASRKFKKELENLHKDVCCLEMEAEGVAAACSHLIPRKPFFVIKGLADLGDAQTKGEKNLQSEEDEKNRQTQAATLAIDCLKRILESPRMQQRWPPAKLRTHEKIPLMPHVPIAVESDLVRYIKNQSSLTCGGINLQSLILPAYQWQGKPKSFADDPESGYRIRLEMLNSALPEDLLERFLSELDLKITTMPAVNDSLKNVYEAIVKGGSNPYPRLVGIPYTVDTSDGAEELLLPLGRCKYGIALIKELKLDLPSARDIRENYMLNSLGVRIALLTNGVKNEWNIEFQKRDTQYNATYKEAWDVSAAGYVDPARHSDPQDPSRISVWQAAAAELIEELNLHSQRFGLPYRDRYHFFGVGVNLPTGQVDVLGYCKADEFNIDRSRNHARGVIEYGRCALVPEEVVEFIADKGYWVPTALVTLILILETFNFPRERIERAFERISNLNLNP